MTTSAISTIIKIGQREHILRLQTRGEVFLNTWGFFRKYELNAVQGDKHEGLAEMFQAANGHQLHIRLGEDWVPIGGLTGQIKFFAGNLEDFNLFCMFALDRDSYQYLDHPALLQFGESALVMTDGDEFISRLTRELNAEGIPYKQNLVKYVEKDEHEGEIGFFCKLSDFKYQSEWRLVAHARRGAPITVTLGDLSDISLVVPTSELKMRFRFQQE